MVGGCWLGRWVVEDVYVMWMRWWDGWSEESWSERLGDGSTCCVLSYGLTSNRLCASLYGSLSVTRHRSCNWTASIELPYYICLSVILYRQVFNSCYVYFDVKLFFNTCCVYFDVKI